MAGVLTKTGLFVHKQSGGMFTVEDQTLSTGNRWFVDSGKTTTGEDGTSFGRNPEAPFLTLAYAFSGDQPVENNGDIIILEAGHTESIAADAGIVCDRAGILVIGQGQGDSRPVLTFDTAAAAQIDISAANITFENITFRCNIADLAAAFHVTGANFTMRNCSFMGTDAADEAFLITILTEATANDMTIENCQFHYLYAANGTTAITTTSTECIRLVGADRAVIRGNYMSGDFTTAVINGITTASLDILLLTNIIHNIADENITGGIDLYTGTTGFLDDNVLYVDDPTSADDIVDAASCAIGRNWVTNAAGSTPYLWGTTIAGGIEGKIDIIDGYHDVPTKDTTDDAQMRDAIGKKDDTAVGITATTKSIIAYAKGGLDLQIVPVQDTTDDANARDVIGKKDDTAIEVSTTTKSLMAYAKGGLDLQIVPTKDTTDDVNMRDVVGKKEDDAAVGAVSTNESLVAIGKQNVTNTEALVVLHGVPAQDTTDDATVSDVAGKKDDAAVETTGTTKSLMAYAKGGLDLQLVPTKDTTDDVTTRDVVGKKEDDAAVGPASTNESLVAFAKQNVTNTEALMALQHAIVITSTIVSSTIPDDGGGTPTGAPITGAASGDLMLEEIIMQTDAATGLAGGTTMQIISDNTDGLTGVTTPIWDEATASLGIGATINNGSADLNLLPIMLEAGKKLYINCDDAVGTGAGTVEIIMKFMQVTPGATIAGV